jgi:hypothetical protein
MTRFQTRRRTEPITIASGDQFSLNMTTARVTGGERSDVIRCVGAANLHRWRGVQYGRRGALIPEDFDRRQLPPADASQKIFSLTISPARLAQISQAPLIRPMPACGAAPGVHEARAMRRENSWLSQPPRNRSEEITTTITGSPERLD